MTNWTDLLGCWYCGGYFPPEKMGDVMCLECEGLGGPEMVEDVEIVKAAVGQIKAKERRVKTIGELMQMTLEEGR